MKKLILFSALLFATAQFSAQMTVTPNKDVTKAIKKNPHLVTAINQHPDLLNSLNLNEDLLEAIVDNHRIIAALDTNPTLLKVLNASPDFLKLVTKKEDVLMALNLNPEIANALNANPQLIKDVIKKPSIINTITQSNTGTSETKTKVAEPEKEKKKRGLVEKIARATPYGLLYTAVESVVTSSGKTVDSKDSIEKALGLDKGKKTQNVFLSKRYDEFIVNHKVVAIIPFSVDIEGENKKQAQSKKERVRNEKEIEEVIQESLYKYLLRNQAKYSVEFQDISTTNMKLKNSGLMTTLYTTPKEELAKALGVDAVIAGKFKQQMKNKDSKSGVLDLTLFDGGTGEWVWKMEEDAGNKHSLIDDTDKLMDNLMEKVANYFPYRSLSK